MELKVCPPHYSESFGVASMDILAMESRATGFCRPSMDHEVSEDASGILWAYVTIGPRAGSIPEPCQL